jgi:hypothetical protein
MKLEPIVANSILTIFGRVGIRSSGSIVVGGTGSAIVDPILVKNELNSSAIT